MRILFWNDNPEEALALRPFLPVMTLENVGVVEGWRG